MKIQTRMNGLKLEWNPLAALYWHLLNTEDKDRLQMLLDVVDSATQRGGQMDPFLRGEGGRGEPAKWKCGTYWWVWGYLTIQYLWHAASPNSHTLPSALGWKQTFGSRGRPRSPARGGKEALTECEAVPLCRPHRTSHLERGVRGEGNTAHIIIIIIRSNSKAKGQKVVQEHSLLSG